MKFLSNRKVAWAVLAVCILTSIVGFGGGSLAARRRDALRVFDEGIDTSFAVRFSMDAYLDRAAECAMVMASEAQLHLGNDNAVALSMQEVLADFGDDDGLDLRYDAYVRLQALSDQLYNAMYAAQLSDDQRVNFKRAYDDFWGSDKFIRKDPYREMASDFNDSLDGFPAGIAASLWNVDELNSFGG